MTPLMPHTTVLHDAITSVAGHLPTLVDVVVRSSLVLMLALVVTTLMRHASAAARHTVWVCAVLIALLIPALGRVAPRWETHILPASWSRVSAPAVRDASDDPSSIMRAPPVAAAVLRNAQATVQRAESVAAIAPLAPPAPAATTALVATIAPTSSSTVATSAGTWSLAEWIAFVWIAGAVLVLLRLALGTGIVWSTARHARRVDDADWLLLVQRKARELGIARPVILLTSPRQVVPVTWGVIYPIVLLPETALAWEPARREAVLVHELAHVARLDALTHTVVQLAMALLWFDPFVWIAARRMRSERERACDDLVLSLGTRASEYADDLLTMVRSLTRNTEPAFAALAMARRSEFEGRMLAILDPRADRRRVGARGVVVAAVASLAIALPLAALRPLPRSARIAASIGDTSRSDSATTAARAKAAEHVHEHTTKRSTDIVDDSGVHTAIASGGPSTLTCSLRNGRHVSINGTDGESNFLFSNDTHCISMVSSGKVTYGADDASIQSISDGGHVTITEVTQDETRSYEARPGAGGLEEKFYVGGQQVPASDATRTWLRGVVLQIVRQNADLAPERVARIRKRSGVAGVLTEVRSLDGDYIKQAYLSALLAQGTLAPDTLRLVTNTGVHELTSDYYKSEFLKAVAKQSRDGATAAIMANAAGGMSSDYYKSQVLSSALSGDGDRSSIAREVIATSTGITSEYYREQVLTDLLTHGTLGDALTVSLIQSAAGIKSDYYLAVVLDSVIATQPVGSRSVYTALLQAAKAIPTDYYRSQVLMHVLHAKDVPPDAVAAVLSSASDIGSANDKANVLVEAAGTPAIRDQSVRQAYFATTKTLGDGSEARRALAAIMQ